MHLYIDLTYVVVALALCGGFLLGRLRPTRGQRMQAERKAFHHYREKYNEQMSELCTRYRQERAAMIHRYEGLVADLETEIKVIRNAVDPERTIRTTVSTNEEAMQEDVG